MRSKKYDEISVIKDKKNGKSLKYIMEKYGIKSSKTIYDIVERNGRDHIIPKEKPLEHYISLIENIHGNKYEYPFISEEFKNSHSKITIKCNKCGDIFNQSLSHHIYSKSGCSNCYGNKPNTIEKILKRSKEVHGENRYGYPFIDFDNLSAFSKITIKCNKCGHIFKQVISSHINKKHGCPKCSKSKIEQNIYNYLLMNKINFFSEYRFDECFYKKPLPFDFYLPDFNLCIEYDGEQHFRKRRDDKYGNNIKLQIFRDNIKTNFCLKNNIKLKRITYKENVSVELKKLFSELNIKEIYSFSDSVLKFINKDRKKCSVCHSVKKLEKFHKSSRMLDGHKSQCKECVKMMSKRYRKNKKMYD